jgi:hypothetical protein
MQKTRTPEQIASRTAASRRWRAKNAEKFKAITAAWRAKNPGYQKQWREKNAEQHRRKLRETRHGCVQLTECPEHCEICGIVMAETTKGAQFDHDHARMFHRGWLCNSCNNGIARFGDTIDGVRKALAYMERAENRYLLL